MMALARSLAVTGLLLGATPAPAQEGGWQIAASAYLWLPATTPDISTR